MEQAGTYISLIGVGCFLVSLIMLMQMVQNAFAKDGFLWGLLCLLFPPGTYKYCRRNWEELGKNFIAMSVLASLGLVFIFAAKL